MKVIMYPAVTLDGFIANEEGECYQWISDEDEENYMNAIRSAGCSIVGRRSFEQYREDFPLGGDIKTFVYSSKVHESDDPNIEYVSGSPKGILAHIEQQGYSAIVVSGGGELNGAFADAGVVTDLIISTYPLSLGKGVKLFGSYSPELKLKLIKTENKIEGIVTNYYKAGGAT